MKITLSNYRCFGDSPPSTFEIGQGITALVGPNNAGKTAVFRFFRDFSGLFASLSDQAGIVNAVRGGLQYISGPEIQDTAEIWRRGCTGPLSVEIQFDSQGSIDPWPSKLTLICDRYGAPFRVCVTDGDGEPYSWINEPSAAFAFTLDGIAIRNHNVVRADQFAAALRPLNNVLYIPAIRTVTGASWNKVDLPLGTQFITEWAARTTGADIKARKRMRQLQEDIGRLLHIPDFAIQAASGSNSLLVRMNGEEFRIEEVGAGIEHLILTLYIAERRRPSWLFIDEPELGLHPSLQAAFVSALASYATHGTVISTHNLGLARQVAGKIYSVRRSSGSSGSSNILPLEDEPELAVLLGEMHLGAYSEGGRHLLVVEGPNDARIMTHVLTLFGLEQAVGVLNLGGDTNAHPKNGKVQISSLSRLCENIWVLLDSERQSAEEQAIEPRRTLKQECESDAVRVHLTERRSLDNYLTLAALRETFGDHVRAFGDYGGFEKGGSWGKQSAFRAAQRMTKADWLATDVGRFIERIAQAVAK